MDPQSDVLRQPLQEPNQRNQEQQNIVYIQQNSQNYRNQNYPYLNDGQALITGGNQPFSDENVNFEQFENHYPFVTNGNYSSSNSSTSLISNSFNPNKIKNVEIPVKNQQYLLENDDESISRQQGNEIRVQFANGNFQSVDLQGVNYQQTPPYFIQNIGNHFQVNDNLVPVYQSSGSSESSDESSASNVSQLQYSSDSSGISNNQFEFPVPVPANNQTGQNLQHFQQKDFLDNYMALLHQDAQVPRCDSSKSETAESTCSSLSSGSVESQSENENVLRLPFIMNPLLGNNTNVLQSYHSDVQNNISSFSNSEHHNESSEFQKSYSDAQSDQNLLKYANFNVGMNPPNFANEDITNANNVMAPNNNQVNNVVVMMPNRMSNKNHSNCLQPTSNAHILQNPSSQNAVNPSKFIYQNPKSNQQKIYSLVNVTNSVLQDKVLAPVQLNQMIKINAGTEEGCNSTRNGLVCGVCRTEGESSNGGSKQNYCGPAAGSHHPFDHHPPSDITSNCASHIENTSDSSVINSNFVQNHLSMNGVQSENNTSAMLLKETSDKSISQSVSDVNNSGVDSNGVYSVKNGENNMINPNCYDGSDKSGFNGSFGINAVPVPGGWKRLLVNGSVLYISPTNVALSSIEQVKLYLQTTGTCKCGLVCPLNCDSVFNFNPKVISRPWDSPDSEQTRLCNHKRKASLPPGSSVPGPEKTIKLNRKDALPVKRKKKKGGGSGSGVSVSQLLAQRERALAAAAAAAAAKWTPPSTRPPGPVNLGYQNVMGVTDGQFQGIPVMRAQAPSLRLGSVQCADAYKRETVPPRLPDAKTAQLSCNNVINGEGTVSNLNGMSQLPLETHSAGNELIRSAQLNPHTLTSSRQEIGQGIINQSIDYGKTVMTSKQEGVVLGPQGMLFSPNIIMQRPRSIPPWQQTRINVSKKPSVPDSQILYEKVPYSQQSMAPPVFEDVINRKKQKSSAKSKKESHEQSTNNSPSFMENPSAYLAQQTALLHNTISRPNFNMLSDTRPPPPVVNLLHNPQNPLVASAGGNQGVIESSAGVIPNSSQDSHFTVRTVPNQRIDQSNFSHPAGRQPNATGKNMKEEEELKNSGTHHNYYNSNAANRKPSISVAKKNQENDIYQINENVKFIDNNTTRPDGEVFYKDNRVKRHWKQIGQGVKNSGDQKEEESLVAEENPVTSSTEKAPTTYHQKIISDTRPIQGGTVSTSNGSPQPQSSPNSSSSVFRQEVSLSPKQSESTALSSNVQISSTNSSMALSHNSVSNQETELGLTQFNLNGLSKKDEAAVLQALQSLGSSAKSSLVDGDQNLKLLNSNLVNITTKSSLPLESYDVSGDHGKAQVVTSSLDEKCSQENTEGKESRFVRTMASSHTPSSNTITSVQAGKTQTATVTVSNTSAPSTTMSFLNLANQNLINVQISQKGNGKSPLEMVQSIVSSIHTSEDIKVDHPTNKQTLTTPNANSLTGVLTSAANVTAPVLPNGNANATAVLKTSPGTLQAGHILVSSNGQYLVASNGNIIPQTSLSSLKLNQATPMPSMSASPVVTNVTGAVTQVLPAVGVAQQVLGQSTVLVNAVPAPFVIQPGVMAVDTGLGRLAVATGNVLQGSVIENNTIRNPVRGVIPADKTKHKKGAKKRKSQVTSLVQMASSSNMILNQPFGQQNFTLSPGGSVQPLQALTLVQGKHGQLVMNNQGNFNQFNSQPQQINLLQPVNLTSVPNFPAFQQFIVPGLGNMVMSTDGTATILPDASNIGVQLQLQNVNGQNVLTPMQNTTSFLNGPGILTTTPTGMLIRAPSNQQKIIQNNGSTQFLSPNNGQFLVNQFQGQLSPLIAANLSPNQQLFATSPQRQSPQEFIQIIPTSSSQNTTVVQQNTTIVQQQTTMVSNNQNLINNSGKSNFILGNSNADKPIEVQIMGAAAQRPSQTPVATSNVHVQSDQRRPSSREKVDFGTQHSVSTQTTVGEDSASVGVTTMNTFCQTLHSSGSGSPPDTTTHSPIESESNYERAQSPADEGPEGIRQAMVQYVSSSNNESEGESDGYLVQAAPKGVTPRDSLSGSKGKNIVESSSILQETGVQIQIGRSYVSSEHFKSAVDECVVSSHSDVSTQEKQLDSQSKISSYQKEKMRMVDAILADGKSSGLDDEGVLESKEKLKEGDLVWGPVRGSPAWPGKLLGPIGPGGKALVRWFGVHSSPTKVNVSQLQSLSQGLEAHHKASNKGRKNRRLNAELEAAIQEAMLDLDRTTAQGRKTAAGRGRPRRLNR